MISAPITVQLEVTERCNYRCPHCYHLVNDVNDNSNFDSGEDDKKILEIAKKLVKMKIFNVVLTGGEPLIKKRLVLNLIKYLRACNINTSLNTNLILMDNLFLNEFMKLGGNSMLVSCPASAPEIYKKMTGNGNYWQFENKIQEIVNKNVHFTVNMVVNRNNLSFVRETAKKMIELGVKRFAVTPMALNVLYPDLDSFLSKEDIKKVIRDIIWIKKTFRIYVDVMESLPKCIFPKNIRKLDLSFLRRKCQAGITTMAISTNGDVRPCTHNPDTYGNIFEEKLSDIWKKMEDWRRGDYIPQECRHCKAINICLGGCRMTARAHSISKDAKDPWMTEVLLENDYKKSRLNDSNLHGDLTINFSAKFQSRREKGGYLISTAKNNILVVNQELFRFIKYLKNAGRITINDLAVRNKIPVNDKFFQGILKILLEKNLIFFSN